MCNIKSVPENGIIPSAGHKTIVSIDFVDMLLSTPQNATLVKQRLVFPNANNAKEFVTQFTQMILEKFNLALKSKFYLNIDCPKNMEELTLGHIGEILTLFQAPYTGQLLWGYTTSSEAHYSVEMLIQIEER